MSLARQHRDAVLGKLSAAVAPPAEGGPALPAVAASTPEAAAAAQMAMRLRHDLVRLKQIQSITKKIEAKREMLPHYDAWVAGVCDALDRGVAGDVGEILPTVMVWRIDTADYAGAADLAERVILHRLPLPTRYQRQAPTLIVEEIADAALRDLGNGEAAPLDVLEDIERLTHGEDMPDEVRAKLMKAIGFEYDRRAAAASELPDAAADLAEAQRRALSAMAAAHKLHDRSGVKDRMRKIERSQAKAATAAAASAPQ
ncbi:MAG TPA: phage terminase small subunit [Allosphingosinicella sp.]|jgi:hypothetical protein